MMYDDYKNPEYRRDRSRSPVDYVMKSLKPEYKEITRTIKLDSRPERYRPVSQNLEIESSTLVSEGPTYPIRAKPIRPIKIEPAPLPPPAKAVGVKYRNPNHTNQGYPNSNQTQTYLQGQLKNDTSTRQFKTEFNTEFKTEFKTDFKNESYPQFIPIQEANAYINKILPVGPNTRVGLKDLYFNEDENSVIVRKNDGTMIKFLTKGINYIYFSVIEGRTVLILIFWPEVKDLKDSEQKKINVQKLAELCDYQGVEMLNVCLWIECTEIR